MNTRIATRLGLGLLIATFATGCTTLRGVLAPSSPGLPVSPDSPATPASSTPLVPPGNTNFASNNPNAYPPNTIPGGTVIAASGTGGQMSPPAGDGQPNNLPQPRPVPAAPPGWPAGVPVPPNGQQPPQNPMMAPPGVPPGYNGQRPPPDPHLRVSPTAAGGRLNLAPWEVPADRVVELSKNLDAALAQNRDLLARIKELETLGLGREQALAEAMREIEAITAAGIKDRAVLQAQILALQGRIKQLEEEDIIFLRAVIDALGKLLPPEKK